MSVFDEFKVTNDKNFKLSNMPTSLKISKDLKPVWEEEMSKILSELNQQQEVLYADGREGVILMLQAMDAAGKDGTIRRVFSALNPQGVAVTSLKQPSKADLAHDYLWRIEQNVPERGMIGVFNRTHYEDVLVVRVHDLYKNYKMPSRCTDMNEKDFFEQRYKQIRNYEEYLYQNGYRLLKVFLHLSKDKQKQRFLDRIDFEEKHWKFSSADIEERHYWDKYQQAYQEAIAATATKENPWYVVPADQKWVSTYIVAQLLLQTLKDCKSEYPVLPQEEMDKLAAAKESLLDEEPNYREKNNRHQKRIIEKAKKKANKAKHASEEKALYAIAEQVDAIKNKRKAAENAKADEQATAKDGVSAETIDVDNK